MPLRVAAFSVLIGLSSVSHAGQPVWHYLGNYSNMEISAGSGDCGGFSVQLWQQTGGTQLIGTFSYADGPCGKPAVPIFDVRYRRSNGKFSFSTFVSAERVDVPLVFQGQLEAGQLKGIISSADDNGAVFKEEIRLTEKK